MFLLTSQNNTKQMIQCDIEFISIQRSYFIEIISVFLRKCIAQIKQMYYFLTKKSGNVQTIMADAISLAGY